MKFFLEVLKIFIGFVQTAAKVFYVLYVNINVINIPYAKSVL